MNTREGEPKILYYPGFPALAYSDVYIYPRYSDIHSRHGSEINTSTYIARGAPKLQIPLVSAGMDTVTEDMMAITMALHGGIGEIHRNNLPEQQAQLVKNVKNHMRVIEDNPPILPEHATVDDARRIVSQRDRGYVIISQGYEENRYVAGIVTTRDLLGKKEDQPLRIIMTPIEPNISSKGKTLITVPEGTTLEQAVTLMHECGVEKMPIINQDGYLIGVYTLKDYERILSFPNAAIDNQGRLLVGAAIGVHGIDVDRALMLQEAGADVLFIDIAHGHHEYTKTMLKRLKIKEGLKIPIIAGNTATKEGVIFLYDEGADAVKVGIGPGGMCTTRDIAGTGVPQITALLEALEGMSTKSDPIPIIADGGIREAGDVPKAIVAGATSVMIGTLFAGTDESPGDPIQVNGEGLKKRVRGMASADVAQARAKMGDSTINESTYIPEGRETFVPYQGSVKPLITKFIGGLRSGMSYAGSHSITEMNDAQLVYISNYGSQENIRKMDT